MDTEIPQGREKTRLSKTKQVKVEYAAGVPAITLS